MKPSELREKTKEELQEELIATRKELVSLRLQKDSGGTGGEAPKPHSFKQVRRKIALIKTILNEKNKS